MGNIKWISSKGKKVQKRKRKTGLKTALIILLILIFGLAAFTVALGFYVDNLSTVYPNVWADGNKLSGMTLEEANRTLQSIGYENNADGVSATISFPDGGSFTITGNEAGFSLNAEEAAYAAFEYGRSGTFFENELNYVRSFFRQTTLRDVSVAKFDKAYVREVVKENTRRFNASLIDNASNISATSIVIVKGAGIEPADEDEVYDLTVATLYRAMEEGAHLTAEFVPNPKGMQEIDLDFLFDTINVAPTDASYDPETMEITDSRQGVSFDKETARELLDKAGIGAQIVIPLFRIDPDVTEDQLQSLFYRDVLYTSTTRIAGTTNRLRNITIASMAIDGKELLPGEVFSFNDTVGRRTAEKGYTEAAAYVSGLTVQEIGGGICQVSSTIYDCVLHSDLEVVERRNHQFTVTYLPLGNDATVNWGSIDFRFRNNSEYPLRIEIEVDGRDLTVTLVGTKLDENYVVIKYTEISATDYKVVEEEDESVPQGQSVVKQDGHRGHVVDTYKYIYDKDDNLLSEERIGRSAYSSQDRLILIPVALPEEEPGETEDPDEGPDDEHAETPPDDTSTETPPDDTSTETPPDDTSTETPETPPETPETPPETPAETPTETPSETPTETPAETPTETPPETPAGDPDDTPPAEPPEAEPGPPGESGPAAEPPAETAGE